MDEILHRAVNSRSRGVRGVFAIMALVVISSVLVTYWFGLRVIRTRELVTPRRELIAAWDHILSMLRDAETAQRGFIITGEEEYLTPYHAALTGLSQEMENLRQTRKVPVPGSVLGPVERLVREKMDELERTIALRRTKGFDLAAAIVRSGEGKEAMDQLRDRVGRLRGQQESALQAETTMAAEATRARTVAFLTMGLLNLVFLLWAYRRITAAFKEREAALVEAHSRRVEVQRQKDLLAVTLGSIGDCVIVTDSTGRITFMNAIAEELTGWTFAEAELRPAAEVFRIVNESSRETVESPVDKVLERGVIVGLANHTMLIRKDGSEVSIDDSGAPIRDSDGTVRGVVLVFRDFSEHKGAEQKLKEARDMAETANKAKDQFLAMLSHELRTPLTPVLATLHLWEASDELSPPMRSDAQMMRRNVELEARIIDDLLDLTRVAKGMLSFTEEETDVHELIGFIAGMCRSDFQLKGVKLSMFLEAMDYYVRTDAARLQQVVWNIIINAAKFTEAGGMVRISTANDHDGNITIRIIDTGIGMTPETLERLFVPFEQGEELISRRYGGLGLGMAISSALVGLLGGQLQAESEGLGKGSAFTVVFPSTKRRGTEAKPASVETGKRSGQGMKILLVEDHEDTARVLGRLLKGQGFEVQAASTVASALQAVREGEFHLLICDLGLPDGTGFELMREVRKSCQTPALALSGFGMEEDVAKAKLAGFEKHFPKPVNFQKLQEAIWQFTAGR